MRTVRRDQPGELSRRKRPDRPRLQWRETGDLERAQILLNVATRSDAIVHAVADRELRTQRTRGDSFEQADEDDASRHRANECSRMRTRHRADSSARFAAGAVHSVRLVRFTEFASLRSSHASRLEFRQCREASCSSTIFEHGLRASSSLQDRTSQSRIMSHESQSTSLGECGRTVQLSSSSRQRRGSSQTIATYSRGLFTRAQLTRHGDRKPAPL